MIFCCLYFIITRNWIILSIHLHHFAFKNTAYADMASLKYLLKFVNDLNRIGVSVLGILIQVCVTWILLQQKEGNPTIFTDITTERA